MASSRFSALRDFCVHEADLAQPDDTAWQAAARMWQRGVGTLAVVDADGRPIGIVTDRDLTERVLAAAKDPNETLVRDIMTREPLTIDENQSASQALALMCEGECRRLLVVDADGALSGLLSLDDLLVSLANHMSQIGQLVRQETPQAIAAEFPVSRWDQP